MKTLVTRLPFNSLFVYWKTLLDPGGYFTIISRDPNLQKSLKIFPSNEFDEMIKL